MTNSNILLQVEHLTKHFPVMRGMVIKRQVGSVQAVDDVSFSIKEGETLGMVGESGCGKSTTGRTILRLYKPTSGKVFYKGQDISALNSTNLRRLRRNMQIIFQDPYASLNPRMTVAKIISEPLDIHQIGTSDERANRVQDLLLHVGLRPSLGNRYPHEFSGGQRQRISIARALALQPDFIVCDEPISALDVSIQAQVVNLLKKLQKEFGLTYLFIAHDLSMVRHICDRVIVMYLGKTVELAARDELYSHPLHPYSQALLSAVPLPDPVKEETRQRIILTGDVPSPINPPSGCRFHPRCPIAGQICKQENPEWREVQSGHWVSCHKV